jgi:hypothetical protein
VTDLGAVVAGLLGEPRPCAAERPRSRGRSSSPLGRALAVFDLAVDLVTEADHAEVLAGWQERQARLRGWQADLGASVVGGFWREALWADVESMRMRAVTRCEQTATTHQGLAAACRRVSTIVLGCKERQAASARQQKRAFGRSLRETSSPSAA